MNSKNSHYLFFTLLGLPFLVYPFLFIEDIVAIESQQCGHQSHFHNVISGVCLFSSVLYPISYLISIALYIFKKIKNTFYIPFAHLLFILISFFYWVC